MVGTVFLFMLTATHNQRIASGAAVATNTTDSLAQSSSSRMGLTSFDKKLAIQLMDKDGDGKCDSCGMGVELCMDSGQLQCNMGPDSTIGVLGSQHVHSDWKIYLKGKALGSAFFEPLAMNMSNPNKSTTSSFIHVDRGAPAPEKTGDVLHMHASGVPLWIFFESVGMKLSKECLELREGEKYCNDSNNTLKFFVNGKPSSALEEYVFQDNDKILISYGNETDVEIQNQLNSITGFSKNH